MIHNMKYLFALTMLLLVGLFGAEVAHAKVYTWSRYDLSFETPDDGFVTFNSATRFEIHWEDMVMTIQLYSQDKGDEKKMLNENLQRKAMGYNMYDLSNGKLKVKGFKKTYSIYGTMPDGSRAIIADIVSKHQNLIIEVTVNYLYGNRETVEETKQKAKQQDKKSEKEKQTPQQSRPAPKEKLYDA